MIGFVEYRKYLLIFILSFTYMNLFSQSVLKYDAASPNVGSLLRVQDLSVNLYTGRPNISIPLYSINFKDFSYDIQLIYNAEGNKPDLPVSNVGLGWSITEGQIYRVANGYPDEIYTISDYLDRTEMSDWSSESNLYRYYEPLVTNQDLLLEPDLDEFIINIGKINASFYIYKDKAGHIKTKISSQNSPYFEVKDIKIEKIPEFLLVEDEWKLNYSNRMRTFHAKLNIKPRPISISEITIVDSDGVTYIFGGNVNSIDFSCVYMQDPNYSTYFDRYGTRIGNHNMAWDNFYSYFLGTASAWHIKRIILPNKENIEFNYIKGNVNVMENFDHHDAGTINFTGASTHSSTIASRIMLPDFVNPQYRFLIDKKYDIVYPSSLRSIYASNGDSVNFVSSKRNDLTTYGGFYDDQKYFFMDNYGGLLDNIINKCYSFKLDEVRAKTGSIRFYYTDKTNQRLKLDSLLVDGTEKYLFQYNPLLLPPYCQMLTDNWGYYNGKNYIQKINSAKFNELYDFRQPDSKYVKAEILEKIKYPTGGEVCLEYEPHTYSKIATQYPFEIKQENGITGGVRIKKITVSDSNCLSGKITKDYLYLNEDSTSSGILSVVPKYTTNGSGRIDYDFKNMSIHGKYSYYNNTSTNINWVDQFHIGYSRVIEMFSDGSKTIYSFVNHDQVKDEPSIGAFSLGMKDDLYNKYTSRELDRGLLKSIKYYGAFNKLLKEDAFIYHLDLNDYLKTINRYAFMGTLPIRVSANKIYTYYPFLKKKVTTHYVDEKNIEEIEEYKYNKYRLMTQKNKYINGDSNNIYEIKTKYLVDLMEEYYNMTLTPIPDNSPLKIYDIMKSKNMFSSPIEKIVAKEGRVISSDITTYKYSGFNAVQDKLYKLDTNAPLENYSSFKISDPYKFTIDNRCTIDLEFIDYDSSGNPIYVIGRDGIGTVFLWSYNGKYLVAEVKNVTYEQLWAALNSRSPESLSLEDSPDVGLLDGLRMKLPKAQITTYTFKPLVGLTGKTDPTGVTTYFDYNLENRLGHIFFRDNRGKRQIIRQYEYNYRNQ